MQRDRPSIAITVKTRQAIRSVLNNLKESILELKDCGLLDDAEFQKLMELLEDRLKYLRTQVRMVQPCPPKVLLREVSWLVGDDIMAALMLDHAQLANFNSCDTMITCGNTPEDIYILVSGLVKMTYMPSAKTMENLFYFGMLPNVDFFTSLRFQEKQEDYIVSGNVIGEMGVLTGRPYDSTMTCETSVQAYKISVAAMHEAMSLFNDSSLGLEARMWKTVSIKIACVILFNVPAYQSWSPEKVKYHLERAFVPALSTDQTFLVNDFMEDVLLIEGQATNANTNTIYYGPCYIPRTVQRLVFPTNSRMGIRTSCEPKLLVIPAKDVDEFDMLNSEQKLEMVSVQSSRCLQHMVQWRQSAAHRNKMKGHYKHRNVLGLMRARTDNDAQRYGFPRTTSMLEASSFNHSSANSEVASDGQHGHQKDEDGEEEIGIGLKDIAHGYKSGKDIYTCLGF